MKTLKIAALSAFAAIGLASAAVAQPNQDQAPNAEASADQKGMMQGDMDGMMAMMNDPEMKEMMRNCMKMMKMKQENMSGE